MPQIEKLRDIRALETIPDLSFYFFIGLVLIVLLFIIAAIVMFWRFYKNKKNYDIRKEVLKRLLNVDFSDSKKAAYQITRYGRYLATEQRSKKLFEQLLPKLEKYKYIQNPPAFDKEDIKYYDLFTESVDE